MTLSSTLDRRITLLAGAFLTSLLVVVGLASIGPRATAQTSTQADGADPIRYRVAAAADGVVQVSVQTGSVTIRGSRDGYHVEVAGQVLSGGRLDVDRRGSRVLVQVEGPGFTVAHLDVRVPAGSRLEVNGLQLDTSVDGVTGDIDLEGVGGTLRVRGRGGEVEVESVSGVVDLEGSFRRVRATSVSGPVDLDVHTPWIEATTVNGPVDAIVRGVETARVETVMAPILFVPSFADGASANLESHAGRIELRLGANASARVHAQSMHGRIDDRWDPPAPGKVEEAPGSPTAASRSRLSARSGVKERYDRQFGAGTSRVTIDSFSGSIVLTRED